jgi:hypothetical protein
MVGYLRKMKTQWANPVRYQLPLSDQLIELNPLIGQSIQLIYQGQISCIHCQQKTNKSFNQGYCYRCFRALAQCDLCIMKPETCHYHQGSCREPEWGDQFCMQPHFVYLANSSGLKVGITRHTQIPTRWIDQGAVQALPIFKVSSRYLSGLIEVMLAQYVSDKTSWQKMLKGQAKAVDLIAKRDQLLALCQAELTEIKLRFAENAITLLNHEKIIDIAFPVVNYPDKVKSLNFDKQPVISGRLEGIKGQYLLLDSGVINIRKFTAYEIELITL